MAVLSSEENVGDSVSVPVEGCRTGAVSGQPCTADVSHVAECRIDTVVGDILEPRSIPAVHDKVKASVTIPVRETELTSTGTPCLSGIEPQQARFRIDYTIDVVVRRAILAAENPLSWFEKHFSGNPLIKA